jgi:WXG100 protein secretion system (Wss), protein YukD
MEELKFTVIHSSGISNEIEAPQDILVRDLVKELVTALNLPPTGTDGKVLDYRLDDKNLGRQLIASETLASANVRNGHTLILTYSTAAGAESRQTPSRISVKSSIGLPLDDLAEVDVSKLLSNEPALMMTLHSYRSTLSQLDDYRRDLLQSEHLIERLNDRLKERNISAALFILGQVQVGFGTNLITNNSSGGWFVFLSGVALNLGALWFSFFGLGRLSRRDRVDSTTLLNKPL